MKMPDICIGTAQFGLNYGLTNTLGQVSEHGVSELLENAHESNIRFLDTAQSYGNAEEVLGRTMAHDHSFSLISKLAPQPDSFFVDTDIDRWERSIHQTLARLKAVQLDSFLLHSSLDLRKPGGQHLEKWLLSLRERGIVKRLGVSIYNSTELLNISPNLLDLVQLPLSLYDQRLLHDGTIRALRSQGCAIHARSVYLQGLLLTSSSKWPDWVATPVLQHHQALEKLAHDMSCQLIDMALGFAKAQVELEAVVIGLCERSHLKSVITTWSNPSPWSGAEWKHWALGDASIIDPRSWPK